MDHDESRRAICSMAEVIEEMLDELELLYVKTGKHDNLVGMKIGEMRRKIGDISSRMCGAR